MTEFEPRRFVLVGLFLAACSGSFAPDGGVDEPDGAPPTSDASPADAGLDAGPPEPPCEPGTMRTGACGFCGTQAQLCTPEGTWMGTSACLGEGECAAGSVETETLEMCAERQRICWSDCTWTAFEHTAEPGECTPGDGRVTADGCAEGEVREQTCDDSCEWVDTVACSDPCGGTARTTPEWKLEVCIPAGPFMRGTMDTADAQPVAEVTLSAYYIDRYPVTNARYRECYMAGACPLPPLGSIGNRSFNDAARDDYPVQSVPQNGMRAFCAWDGRRLPTEAEWEKAVRGPSPRTNPFPWDGTEYRCDLIPTEPLVCDWRPPPEDPVDYAVDRYDGLPGSVSYYGTFLQYGGVPEFVSDLYSATYYADPASLTDPTGPPTGTSGVVRGFHRTNTGGDLARRQEVGLRDDVSSRATGFRCARSAP